MISRSAISRGSQLALRRPVCAQVAQKRGFASPAPGTPGTPSASYEPTDVAGIKVASKDTHGATSKLAVVVKAGTRYQPIPGLTVGLEEFAFKNTEKRSALRITREAELLGGQLKAHHTREALVLEASFLRDDLPYFAELLGEVVTETKYTTHEFQEQVAPVIRLAQAKYAHDVVAQAVDGAHAVAFHTGLGQPIYPSSSSKLSAYQNEHTLAEFASAAYTKPNMVVVADGADAKLSEWVSQFFKAVPSASSSQISTSASKYHGGEQRKDSAAGNALVIAFPSGDLAAPKHDIAVLVALLGGESSISWTPGFTLLANAATATPKAKIVAKNYAYSDAGLLTIQITGAAAAIREASKKAVEVLNSVAEGKFSAEQLKKAIAKAKFDALISQEQSGAGLVSAGTSLLHGGSTFNAAETIKGVGAVTAEQVKAAAKKLLANKASVSTVGDLHVLPFAEELNLKV